MQIATEQGILLDISPANEIGKIVIMHMDHTNCNWNNS
jgi:hypothetical protein